MTVSDNIKDALTMTGAAVGSALLVAAFPSAVHGFAGIARAIYNFIGL